jgi:CheY-like chemotaxis protein
LPTVRGIVDNYKGVIAVHSQAGRGTTFQIYLPAQPSAELAGATETPSSAVRGNGELILVVDDDDSVRDVTSVVLTRHGYRVLAAANGTEAIALFAPRSLEIRMIVTDVGMPELDGCALVQIVRRLNPATRILAISGLHDASDRLRHVAYEGPVLTKPFTSEEMLHAIHDALAGETASR